MTTASKSAAASTSMSRAAACEPLMFSFPTLGDGPLGGSPSSVHAVKIQGTAGQHATLRRLRGTLQALAHHVRRAREETVLMRIIRRPHDLVGADIVGQHRDAALDRLERDPAIAPKQVAWPHLRRGLVEPVVVEMAV